MPPASRRPAAAAKAAPKPAAKAAAKAAPPRARVKPGRLIDVKEQRVPAAALGRRSPPLAQERPFLLLVYSERCPHCVDMLPAWNEVVPQVRQAGLDVVQLEASALQRCVPGESVIADAVRSDPRFMGVPYIAMADPATGGAIAHHDGERSARALADFVLRSLTAGRR